ncbi:AEC family transporter [Blastococcus sp. TBT05-19]|uniref:AEC family transporter n=1 Tax=Blastococcus sp. TBT05-19 TaxID=2250581 RepID=UPI000DEB5B99|nr:AEC family transporter [Blastococcus sp. TBT05-19]RBY89123.1 AEC family transporter [Blastococcus sp. TBT05-19]
MTGVLGGFVALAAVIAVGWVVGRTGVLGPEATGILSRLSFFVATPALLFLTLGRADTHAVLSFALIGTAGSAVFVALLHVALAWWRWRLPAAELATGALSASYVNAGNLGIPVSVYILGDAAYVAPVLLFQVLVMAPVGLAVLARSRAGGPATSRWQLLLQPLRTPVVIGCALGLLLAASGTELPPLVLEPVELIAGLAVPAALLAYGMSLHGAPRPAAGPLAGQVWLAVALKTVAMPAVAYALGRWVAGLDGVALLAVTVTSALPTAQNVFVYAATYDRGTLLARDVILLSTLLSVPVLVGIAVVLG